MPAGLLGYRAEIGHGEAVGGQGGVETLQGDAALGLDISFFRIDLLLGFVVQEKKGIRSRNWCLETRQRTPPKNRTRKAGG